MKLLKLSAGDWPVMSQNLVHVFPNSTQNCLEVDEDILDASTIAAGCLRRLVPK